MDKKSHNRSSSHGRKLQPAISRPTRPVNQHKRQSSYNNSHGSSVNIKQVLGANKKVGVEIVSGDEDETGMASFLQFCATCEKQIVTPGSSILYCSESCRRKDVTNTNSFQPLYSPTALPAASSYFDSPPSEILPQRSPTVLRPLSSASDLSLPSDGSLDTLSSSRDRESEALRFLSQFHSQPQPTPSRRPRPNRHSTASESGIPSLINTPSSSVGTAASTSNGYQRPLPRRHDPATCRCARKSVDLVIPTFALAATPPSENGVTSSVSTIKASDSTDSIDFAFEKRRSSQGRGTDAGGGGGSLKQLIEHQVMMGEAPDHAW